ncbi:MAG: hypothetical protein P4L82_16225 [Ancalomicrobiaceae bacterium]|nr:hypothetical protein [Ancalomicrobiaceae bacterium]
MHLSVEFAPLVQTWVVVAAAILVGTASLYALYRRIPGAWMRAGATILFLLALLDPAIDHENREPLPTVVALVTDRSQSQNLADRRQTTEAARQAIADQLGRLPGIDLRELSVSSDAADADGTRAFAALAQGLADVPPERIGAAILLTDGQVHDVPKSKAALGFDAPLHVLLSGHDGEVDRRVAIDNAPRFGLVGSDQTLSFRVIDNGVDAAKIGRVKVAVRTDGIETATLNVRPGDKTEVKVKVAHGGDNIVEIEAAPLAGELTPVNNRAIATIDGIREHLRVLLVSGEPHAGERTWRNLLKSDASVDLVHFTILRPPEKQDGTPINELSLIAFPTRELFQEKIKDFDLIIFDRYQRRGILPALYYDNVARYVRDGGAVLVASGPDFNGAGSLFRTPLSNVLPADPTGKVFEEPFLAMVSPLGKRHPVTRDLPGGNFDPPHWSRWFRMVEVAESGGTAVMQGPDAKPLLILSHEGKGRVGLLTSDHVWLWARGYEGGGPHGVLLRRLAHWLMKEPDLEEEALRLVVRGRDIVVERQTLADQAKPVQIVKPTGETSEVKLTEAEPGLWRAELPAHEMGLWRATDGTFTALASVGPANPREFTDVISTDKILAPLARETNGSVRRIVQQGSVSVPRILTLPAGSALSGSDWIGIRQTQASVLKGIDRIGVFLGLAGLLLLVGSIVTTWWREGR